MAKIQRREMNEITFNAPNFTLIAGPCVIENEEITRTTAAALRELTDKLGIPLDSGIPLPPDRTYRSGGAYRQMGQYKKRPVPVPRLHAVRR